MRFGSGWSGRAVLKYNPSMPQYLAFLRAINVGGHVVAMDRLRSLFESLGLSNVETFIASGNVIFQSPSKSPATLEKKIEGHLEKALGYKVATFLRPPSELADIAGYKPFKAAELNDAGNTLYIGFLAATPSREAQAKLMTFRGKVDDFHVHEREVYWLCRKQFSKSEFSGGKLEKTLGIPATIRNSSTVHKLVRKYPA